MTMGSCLHICTGVHCIYSYDAICPPEPRRLPHRVYLIW
jgi:hypothetical protein